jgi:hypothetical protein
MKTDTNDCLSIVILPPVLFLRLWVSAFCWISCSNKAVPIDVVAPDYLQWDPILFAISGYLALGSMIVLLHNKTPFDPSKPTVKIIRQGLTEPDVPGALAPFCRNCRLYRIDLDMSGRSGTIDCFKHRCRRGWSGPHRSRPVRRLC